MKWYIVLGAAMLVQACTPAPQVVSRCDPAALAAYVGADRATVAAHGFSVPVRWVVPNGIMSLDYNPNRINFRLNADEVITRVYCG